MKLAKMMRLLMAAEGIQQKDLATQLGISESTLSRFLNDVQMPDAKSFAAIMVWCFDAQSSTSVFGPIDRRGAHS